MLFGWDDEVWKVFIQGGYGFLTAAFATYLTFKLNRMSKTQLENSFKIDSAAKKAEEAKKAVEETNIAKELHLNRQDEMIETVKEKVEEIVNKTNGMIEDIKAKAHREGHASGEKAALTKLGMEPKRTTDLE